MKLSHIFSALFAVLGTICMVTAMVLCLFFRNAEPRMTELPQEAEACSEVLMEALGRGDYETAGSLIYGQPDLGVSQPGDETAALVWEAFLDSISYTFEGDLYAEGSNLYRDVTITTLDVPSVTDALPGHAQAILARKVENAENPSALYLESGELLPQILTSTLREAVNEALSQGETVTCQGRLQLIRQDGRWRAIPGAKLLKAISGGFN